jgi:CheY-like chemotaxis protein
MIKILVVDDEEDIKLLFEQRFRKEIKKNLIEFTFALSGEKALEYLDTPNQEKILILSDINMPGMSGLELLRRIRQKYTTTPPEIMMITAYGDSENKSIASEMGANGFITKPIDFSLLREKLNIPDNG